jgi:hypothetical protein
MGMPMRVMRADKLIATLRAVDVRHRICGAVIQEMVLEKLEWVTASRRMPAKMWV